MEGRGWGGEGTPPPPTNSPQLHPFKFLLLSEAFEFGPFVMDELGSDAAQFSGHEKVKPPPEVIILEVEKQGERVAQYHDLNGNTHRRT